MQGYNSATYFVNQGVGKNFSGHKIESLSTSDAWETNGVIFRLNGMNTAIGMAKFSIGALDGRDVIFRQAIMSSGAPHIVPGQLDALVFDNLDGIKKSANFIARPMQSVASSPGPLQKLVYRRSLSFGDMNGDGQSDMFRGEHMDWADDNFDAFTHTKWDESFSLTQAGRLDDGVSVFPKEAGESFASGRIGAVNYYIWYDDNGILQYKLRQSGDDGWRQKKALPLIGKPQAQDNNSQPVHASKYMGIKAFVYNDAIYTVRFNGSGDGIKAIVDRWNLKRTGNDVSLIAAKVYQNQGMVMEKTVVLDLESNYLAAASQLSIMLIKPSLQSAPKLHFIYAQTAEKVVDRSVPMGLDGSLQSHFETSMEFNSEVKGNEFMGAMLAEQKGEIALTANAEKETSRKTAVVTASVNIAFVLQKPQGKFVSLYQVTHGGQLQADKNNSQLINHAKDSMQFSTGHEDHYLGMVADSHNPWGVNVVVKNMSTDGVRVFRPKEKTLNISSQILGYGTQSIKGMVAGTYLSASRFCNQMILLLGPKGHYNGPDKPYPFNIDCRAVELVRYGTEVSVASIDGIIEGPPPFPAENLVEFASSVSDYASITLDETAGKQLQLTKQSGSGKITESGGHLVLVGVGGYGKNSFAMNSVKEFGEMLAETTKTTIHQPPVKQTCETYNLVNETYRTRYHRLRDLQDGDANNTTGYDPKCFLNTGSLLVTGSLINIYGIADKQDGMIYGFIPVPQNGAPDKYIKSFPINRNYLRVGSLDGRQSFMGLAGRKQHGDGPGAVGSAVYNRNFDSYLGLADQYLNDYQEKIKAANQSEKDKIKNAYPEAKINALKNGGAMSAAYSKDVGVGKGGELNGIVEVNHNLPIEASFTFTAASGSGATSSLIEASSRRSLSYSHTGEVKSGFKHLASFSAGGLVFSGEIENSELHAGAGDSWSFQVDRDVTTTNSQEFTMYQNPLPLRSLAYGSQSAPVASKCLGLVEGYKAYAHYLPPAEDNYKHFLDNVFDYAMPNHGYEGFKRKEVPWRITYTVPHVHRLKPPTDGSCDNL